MIFKEIDNMKDVGAICHYFPSLPLNHARLHAFCLQNDGNHGD